MRGIWTGLAPLILLVVLGALAVALTILVRDLTNGEAFLSQQAMLVAILGIGLLVAFGAEIAGIVWSLRRARAWERLGAWRQAAVVRWTLAASALILLLPVIVAIVFPQHPAQPAP